MIICILMVLVASVAAAYYFRTIEDEIPNNEKCSDLGVDGDISLDEAKIKFNDDEKVYCWCKQQPTDDLLTDDDVSSYCDDYAQATAEMFAGRIGISLCILTLNFVIREVLRLLTEW